MFNELRDQLVTAHNNIMPNSGIVFGSGQLSNNVMFVNVLLGKDISEMPNRIMQNDPLRVRFMITKTDELYEVEPTMSISNLKPLEKFYAMSSEKIRTRKFKGDAEKVVATLSKYMKAVRDRVAQLDADDRFLALPYEVSTKVN